MEKATAGPAAILKRFFERADSFAPNGGRKLEMSELSGIPSEERRKLAALAAIELGDVEVTP